MAKFITSENCNVNLDNIVSIKITKVAKASYFVNLLDINKVPFPLFYKEENPDFLP